MANLSNCGCCGGKAELVTESINFNGKNVSVERKFRIKCSQCGNELRTPNPIIIFASIDENGRVHESNNNLLMSVKEWNLLQQKIIDKKRLEEVLKGNEHKD